MNWPDAAVKIAGLVVTAFAIAVVFGDWHPWEKK